MKECTRRKLRLWSRILIGVALIGVIPLTLEVFDQMRPEYITTYAIVTGIGLFGSNTCTLIWGLTGIRRKDESAR